MPEPSRDTMQRALASLVSDREAVRARERELIAALGRLLEPLGYHLVPTAPGRPGRAGRSVSGGRRPARAARAVAPLPAAPRRRARRGRKRGARPRSRA